MSGPIPKPSDLFRILLLPILLLSCSPGGDARTETGGSYGDSSLRDEASGESLSLNSADSGSASWERSAARELLYAEALKKHLDKDPSIRRQVEEYRKDLLAQSYLDFYLSDKVQISEEEILEYYRENRESFRLRQDRARIIHYLFSSSDDANSSKRILLYGDPAQKNGLTERFLPEERTVNRGMLIAELDAAVFRDDGQAQIIGPVHSEYGYHLVDVREYLKSGSYLPVAEVRQLIRERLSSRKKEQNYQQLIDELKEKHETK